MSAVRVRLERSGPCHFVATDELGNAIAVGGSPAMAEEIVERSVAPDAIPSLEPSPAPGATGFRPMALLLVSTAACAALDTLHILTKQREPLGRLEIEVEGWRVEGVPSPYERLRIAFVAFGPVDPARLERAAELGVRRYCSVGETLRKDLVVDIVTEVRPAS